MTATGATTIGYPRWVPVLAALPPLFFAAASVSTTAGEGRGIVAAAVGLALVPWLVGAVRGRSFRDPVFAAWVIVPIAAMNLAGSAVGVDLSGASHNQFSLMILVWLVGEMAARAAPMLVGVVAVAAVATMAGRGIVAPEFGHSWAFWAGGAGVALVTGFLLRRQQQTLSALRVAQAALADEAVLRERQRIAREVHDVVAHTLTVTLMHVSAARRALDRDPDGARVALDDAETLGRRSLADIRRTVGLLRTDGEPPATRALPDGSDVGDLLASYRAAGVDLHVDVAGDPASLPPASGLTLYRVVQEAVSNAAAHAPGQRVDVVIRVEEEAVGVTVANPAAESREARPGGLGLVGMRERVALLDGTFSASQQDGRWTVTARFPHTTSVPASEALA